MGAHLRTSSVTSPSSTFNDSTGADRVRNTPDAAATSTRFEKKTEITGPLEALPELRHRLNANIRLRAGPAPSNITTARTEALSKAEEMARAGAPVAEMQSALHQILSERERNLTPDEQKFLKHAVLAQVVSTSYSVAHRFHGGAQNALSTHNLPKGFRFKGVDLATVPEEQQKQELADMARNFQTPITKAVWGMMHIAGYPKSPFVSLTEDPVAFVNVEKELAKVVVQRIVNNSSTLSTYAIPDQHLTRPADIDTFFRENPRSAKDVAARMKQESPVTQKLQSGNSIFAEDDSPITAKEALYMNEKHLDTYSIGRSPNPFRSKKFELSDKTGIVE